MEYVLELVYSAPTNCNGFKSFNELLAGEIIAEDKTVEYSEQNLISTIDYSNKKIKDEHKKISLLIMSTGILICIYAFKVFFFEKIINLYLCVYYAFDHIICSRLHHCNTV